MLCCVVLHELDYASQPLASPVSGLLSWLLCCCLSLNPHVLVQIVSSSYMAAAYLNSICFRQQRLAAGKAPCVLLMGSSGMRDELEAVGLQVRG